MNPAPSILAGTYVVAYAHVDTSVTFVQRKNLSVDGEWLGRVPCIAICEDFESSDLMIQYCDESWDTLGIAGGLKNAEDAKRRAELSYVGIAELWRDATVSKIDALARHKAELEEERCSFCGRSPLEIDMMFGVGARICNYCVQNFSKELHAGTGMI
jgi:ClpX C4-type zinc finger